MEAPDPESTQAPAEPAELTDEANTGEAPEPLEAPDPESIQTPAEPAEPADTGEAPAPVEAPEPGEAAPEPGDELPEPPADEAAPEQAEAQEAPEPESPVAVEQVEAPDPESTQTPAEPTELTEATDARETPEMVEAPDPQSIQALLAESTEPDDTGEAPAPVETPEPGEAATEPGEELPEPPADEAAPDPAETAEPQEPAGEEKREEPIEEPDPDHTDAPTSPEVPEQPVSGEYDMPADEAPDPEAPAPPEESQPSEPPAERAESPEQTELTTESLEAPEPEHPEVSPAVSADEISLQGQLGDRIRSVFGDRAPQVREISEFVDRPEFQVPERMFPPELYGTPLDRPDGTRTPLFDGPPKRKQTKQGALGDCGVIATLGAVAEHRPQDIMNAIRENEDGTYEVRFHGAKSVGVGRYEPTGDIIKLTVTPDLPIFEEFPGNPTFADSVSTEAAWAPIMEKAIAGLDQTWTNERSESWMLTHNRRDLRTGYVRLDGGTKSGERAEMLVQLTGLPAATWDLPTGYDHLGRSAKRQVLDHFTEKLADNCPIIVGTKKPVHNKDKPPPPPPPKGLHVGHAYEVTGVDEKQLIHLRNPHNKDHPKPVTFKEFQKYFLKVYTTLEPKWQHSKSDSIPACR
ncbi:C2 family cysteine protease [Streptomyces sp. NPDC002523]